MAICEWIRRTAGRRAVGAIVGVVTLFGLVETVAAEEGSSSDWEFYATPYLWMAGFGTETRAVGPIPANDFEVDFADVLENLNFALEGTFEARKDRFIVLLDFNYFDLETEEGLDGAPFTNADIGMTGILASANAGYRVVDEAPVALDLFGGAQVFHTNADLSLTGGGSPSASKSDTFVDPIVGIRSFVDLGGGFVLGGAASIGGFGVDSDLTWQAHGEIGWQANDWLTLRAGYRHFQIETGTADLIDSMTMSGPIIGATFRL